MVKELILFIASNSRASATTFSIVQRNRLPIDIVRLDTPESRNRAMNGREFQITTVPTLLVIYDDSSELIVGANRVNLWLTEAFLSQPKPEPEPMVESEPVIEEIDEEEEPPSKVRVRQKKRPPPVDFESVEPEESIQDQPKKINSRMSDIVNEARRLEEERKASLGYDETKLPKH